MKLSVAAGNVAAALTGDHFKDEDADVANAMVGCDLRTAMFEHGSPTYLVPDSAISLAADMHERGNPSGQDAFTTVALGGIKLPDTDLSRRLKKALADAIGMVWSDAPWDKEMSDERVEDVFNMFGISQKKEEER